MIIGATVLFATLATCSSKPAQEPKPNIIYIMLDEMGYYEPSYMGNKMLETPNIDKMAEEGIFGPNVNPETGEVFKGNKGNIYEGGLKIPMVVRWPEKIEPATHSELVWYFPDFMATVADLVNVKKPTDCDGLSILPTLTGAGIQEQHGYMFWIGGDRWAVRSGDWKAISAPLQGESPTDWELYNPIDDKGETTNVAGANPAQLRKLINYAFEAFNEPIRGEIYDKELYIKDHKINLPKPPRNK